MNKILLVINEIDNINLQDPRKDNFNGKLMAKEYLYSLRMTDMLNQYDPKADDLLKIAARGQHIKRWDVPRHEYPMDRKGYLQWRNRLKLRHADLLAQIMQQHGYNNNETEKVATLITKRKLDKDKEAQKLEDVVCLVFLKYYFEEFSHQHPEEKVVDILRKTWKKMTDKGKAMALELHYPPEVKQIISKALGD